MPARYCPTRLALQTMGGPESRELVSNTLMELNLWMPKRGISTPQEARSLYPAAITKRADTLSSLFLDLSSKSRS